MLISRLLVSFSIVTCSSFAVAQNYEFTIDPEVSLIDRALNIEFPISGTLIGNYDAETNPEGTQTLPGLFGGSGNNPVDFSANNVISGSSNSNPNGSFDLDLDLDAGTVQITDFSVDVLAGSSDTLSATLRFLYENFRTVNPTSVFFGGIEIPIPLGNIVLNSWTLQQSGPSILLLGYAAEDPGNYSVTGTVLMNSTFTFTLFEQEIAPGPLPLPLLIDGILTATPDGFEFQLTSSTAFDEPIPVDGFEFTDLPLPLPTILPPGGTANLLLNALASEGTSSGSWSVSILANGIETDSCTGGPDLNGDGLVNGEDLTMVLATWGQPNGAGDVNCDGTVSGPDLSELLANWKS